LLTQLDQLLSGGHPLSDRVRNLLVEDYVKSRPKPKVFGLLTPREREIAERKCRGLGSGAIARDLGISVWTVRTHERDINSKLNIHNRAELQCLLYGI
jgi:DNA-binding CsgD family transcriptional regulator